MAQPDASRELIALQEAVVGRFSLVRELGRGGMGLVFLARDVALDRPVAIKLLPPEFAVSTAHRQRFLREARTAARLSHPHIVPIHSVEEIGDLVFFVMSYVDGETLAARVRRDGALPSREAMRITREIAWAIGHAHANGIVHRDVKPENVLLERESGRALVTDFGIAQAMDGPNSSAQGRVAGTPRYMSPEQAAGESVDGRSDLYSLGAVAFFMVTGRSPYEASSAAAMLVKHMNDPVPSVLSINPAVPGDFARAIERCLAKIPADRFQTSDELARLLEPSTDRMAAPIASFVRDMEVAGGEIGLAASGLVSSAFMASVASSHLIPTGGLGSPISTTVAFVLFLGAGATTAGLLAVRLGYVIGRIRRLLAAGYKYSAVQPALSSMHVEPALPSAKTAGASATRFARVVGTLVSIAITRAGNGWTPLLGAAGAIALPTMALRELWNQKDVWPRALAGRFGRMLFRVASLRLGATAENPAIGEPTVAAIGSGANKLFHALPESVQAEYAHVPGMIEQLEGVAIAGRSAADPGARRRYEAAVSALESVRLDLLRMHAGMPARGDLTGNIEAARRLGADIDTRLAAEAEIDQALRNSAG